ncbi:uncharacterized protein EDB91DRAFT_1103721 [Suillus paluster]|uniref:uncharacterized protein n=1 Tax=Suillus paluster TaxID=48578 RepID=UPI001B85D96C|nr:uncharacterized protein EDB91DRAFT_1103721 [Suillus paluster]KAG1752661.1 hypothetical protein EDB91DRAFT_1103721 [Suillus paluster]
MLSSQYTVPQQQTYAQQQAAMAMNTLLPTPPSSPPRVGLHPVESTITLLENLVAFYHQERMWVYRTRAQLEMSLQERDASAAAAATQDEEDMEKEEEEPDSAEETSETTKWMKRKKAFGLKLEGIATTRGMPRGGIMKQRPILRQPISAGFAHSNQTQISGSGQPTLVLGAGGREPGVEILEMFERMMQARMESCERVTRMVRNASGAGSPGQGYANNMIPPPPHGPVYGQSSFFIGAGMG